MSVQDYNTVRALKLHEILNNPANRALVRQYAQHYCTGRTQVGLLKLVA